jgi:flagella basal body P-ring formation protein FlgA
MMKVLSRFEFLLALLAAGGPVLPRNGFADATPAYSLRPQALVDSQGIFLDQIVTENSEPPLPHLRLADPPQATRPAVLTRTQVVTWLQSHAPEMTNLTWVGAEKVRISRRLRVLNGDEVKQLLCATLQRDCVRERGELELNLGRPWAPISIPDETLELRVLEMPATGIGPNFVVRLELRAQKEVLGNWQVVVQARLWHDVLVAATALKRGQPLGPNDLLRERRDLLALREPLITLPADENKVEFTENLPAGTPLTARSLRPRLVVHRGDLIEALLQDGALSISLKVEVMEEGACGQAIRVRNPASKREFRGKVQNEQTILVSL